VSHVEDDESHLAGLIHDARLYADMVSASLPSVAGDQFPEATAVRVMLSVVPLYHAAVQSCAEPATALAALALLRPLIEAFGYLAFIVGEDDMADAACRALRVEIAWANAMVGVVQSGKGSGADLQLAETRAQEIQTLKDQRKCAGGPYGYGKIESTIKNFATTHEIGWLPGMLRTSGQMMHVGGFDWSLEDQGDGTSAIVAPDLDHRIARLNHLIVLFNLVSNTAMYACGVQASQEAHDHNEIAHQLIDDTLFSRFGDPSAETITAPTI
jgi:hypothetical protein